MKERIEKYVDAMIKAEEAKFIRIMAGTVIAIVVINIMFSWLIATSAQPGATALLYGGGIILIGLIYINRMRKEEEKANMEKEALHPTEGDEGAVNVAREAINNSMNVFGKKFLGVRRKDEIANDIENDYRDDTSGNHHEIQ